MDTDALQYVKEDLLYLRTQWGPDIQDPDIRRGSAVLRRLLVEGVYSQAWRAAGFPKQPRVVAVDLDGILGDPDPEAIVLALAWGAHFRGMYFAASCLNKGTHPLGEADPPLRADGYPGEREYTLSDFLESTSGITGKIRVNRREIIKYVANVKGGVHLGQKTKSAEKELIRKLEKFERSVSVHTTDGVFVELVAIAQAIGHSEDAAALVDAIGKSNKSVERTA